jgi:hypothetical protein
MIRSILLAATATTAAGLLFVNIYNSVVDAPNWGANLPHSIETARAYFAAANPGTFYRIASPLNQVLAFIALILSWRNNRYVAVSLLLSAILADILTFGYFYPRNDVMFVNPVNESAVRIAWEQWSTMNWVRTALCLVNTTLAFILLIFNSRNTFAK